MIEENVSLARHTTIGTGGAARWFARPDTIDALQEALSWGRANDVAVEVIGLGEKEPKVRYPRVLKKVGASPVQYPDWDDEAEEYRGEEADEPERLD